MKNQLSLILTVLLFCAFNAAGQAETVLLDNEWVRVRHFRDEPGTKRAEHSHKDTVVVVLTPHQRRLITAGKIVNVDVKAGQAVWFDNITHSEENSGKTVGELLIVDLKKGKGSWRPSSSDSDPAKWAEELEAVKAAPGNHKVILENDRVRVLDVTVAAGENEKLHMHRMPSLLYMIAEDDIQDLDASGKVLYDTRLEKDPAKTPYAVWMDPQPPHRVINRSKNALRLIRVELK